MFKHIILDFDGVIADTFDFHLEKVNEFYKIGLTAEEYREIHEGNFYHSTDSKVSSLDFKGYPDYVKEEQALVPPFPLAIESLRELHAQYTLHLVTSGYKVQVMPFLQKQDVEHLFTSLLFADHGTSKVLKIESIINSISGGSKDDFIFITDTLGDGHEAHEINVPTIAVTFGFHDEERLRKGSPSYIAHSWTDVVEAVQGHFSL